MVDDHEPGVRPHGVSNVAGVNEPRAVERHERRFGAVVADHVVDRPDDGVMFEVGGDDVVARRDESGDDEVERIGHVVTEDQPVGGVVIATKEFRHALAQAVEE